MRVPRVSYDRPEFIHNPPSCCRSRSRGRHRKNEAPVRQFAFAYAESIAAQAQKTTLYTKLVEELKTYGIAQNDNVVSIVTNSDVDWSFGNGRAQFLTGEL